MKKIMLAVAVVVLTGSWLVVDRAAAEGDANPYEGREHLRLDHEALNKMTREERREAMRAYKEARMEDAIRRGEVPSSEGGYHPLAEPREVREPVRPKIPGTNVTYDNGTVTGTAGVASQMLGNRFDSALNPPGTMCCFPVETTGSITQITFDMQNTFFGSAVFSLYSDVSGTMAVQITSMARPGIMTGLNTLPVMSATTMNSYMNGTFLAGIWQFDPTMTGLGVGTGTTGGQGFHAISINDGAAGTMLVTLMSLNAVFRVTGDVATPVELMNFEIE